MAMTGSIFRKGSYLGGRLAAEKCSRKNPGVRIDSDWTVVLRLPHRPRQTVVEAQTAPSPRRAENPANPVERIERRGPPLDVQRALGRGRLSLIADAHGWPDGSGLRARSARRAAMFRSTMVVGEGDPPVAICVKQPDKWKARQHPRQKSTGRVNDAIF